MRVKPLIESDLVLSEFGYDVNVDPTLTGAASTFDRRRTSIEMRSLTAGFVKFSGLCIRMPPAVTGKVLARVTD